MLEEGQKIDVKVVDVNAEEKRLSLSIKDLLEKEEEESYGDYEMKEETGFSLSDVIGDQLKKFTE